MADRFEATDEDFAQRLQRRTLRRERVDRGMAFYAEHGIEPRDGGLYKVHALRRGTGAKSAITKWRNKPHWHDTGAALMNDWPAIELIERHPFSLDEEYPSYSILLRWCHHVAREAEDPGRGTPAHPDWPLCCPSCVVRFEFVHKQSRYRIAMLTPAED
jgi:hypothetical protein